MMLYLTVRLSVKNPKYEESEKKRKKRKDDLLPFILLYKSIKRDKKTCGRQKKRKRETFECFCDSSFFSKYNILRLSIQQRQNRHKFIR